jgi:Uma2 family endonuclease
MTAAKKLNWISVEDYLEGELVSTVKHEYFGGMVFAMAGARNVHNRIALNTLISLGNTLRDKRCQPFDGNTKIRIRLPNEIRFYYPDGSVICQENGPQDSFQDNPAVVIEVLSRSTRRIDTGEKKNAYLTIPSLSVYLLIEQESPTVTAYRRTAEGFVQEVYDGQDGIVPLGEIETELPLSEVFRGVVFAPEKEDDNS